MSQDNNSTPEILKVTFEDLASVQTPETVSPANREAQVSGQRDYGTVSGAPDSPIVEAQKGSIWLKGWFYLGGAGFLGALSGWAIAEPGFVDGGVRHWGNIWLLPLVIAVMCIAFGLAESAVERSYKKALFRAGIALPLGVVLGFIFYFIANLIYAIGITLSVQMGASNFHNPATWVARGIAWMMLGAAGGIVYGIVDRSIKKVGYGVLGGALGAALGGMIFDPISFATHGGAPSRAVGFAILGLATGVAMGLVESALKDRWLYVTQGPLAGKQFILYKPQTVIGSSQNSDIYLFKDPQILPQHATLQMQGARVFLHPQGMVYVAGQPVQRTQVLQSGSLLQIGRYSFRYQERQRQ